MNENLAMFYLDQEVQIGSTSNFCFYRMTQDCFFCFRHRLQRLENDEREAERDLVRLNHDLARVSVSSLSNRRLSSRPSTHFSRSSTPRISIPIDPNLIIEPSSQRTHILLERPMSVYPSGTSIDRLTPMDYKRLSLGKTHLLDRRSPWISKQIQLKFNENRSDHRFYVDSINEQKREIEEKLKVFLH